MGQRSSENLMVKTLSEEHKRKLSEAHKGKATWNKGLKGDPRMRGMEGRHHSEETKQKLSQSKKGKPSGNKGWKMTEEQKIFLRSRMKKGIKHHNWKGGKILKMGYAYIKDNSHPKKTKEGYVLEHRLVMEKMLGRYLNDKEVIHHIDENLLNNSDGNLILFNTSSEHISFHHKLRKNKNIAIIGIGYIGSVAIPCLSKLGHKVIGVDIDTEKIKLINKGESPLKETGLDKLMKQQFKTGRIKATKDLKKAVKDSEIIFVCVDTPKKKDGNIELKYLTKVCNDVGDILKNCNDKKYIVIRSTVFPGTVENMQTLIEKNSGKKEGVDFHLLHHPEFMREGSSVKDFFDPSFIVIGSKDKLVGNYILGCYSKIKCKKFIVGLDVSQMIKYVNNVFHALKVDWANEIGSICKKLNIDGQEVMNLFCKDTQLNLSPYYLSPGFAWGAHCLPKEAAALTNIAKKLKVKTPLLNSVIPSNEEHIKRAIKLIESKKKKRLGFLGLSAKAGTFDLRGNPVLKIIDYFKDKKYNIVLYDEFMEGTSLEKVLGQDLIIISTRDPKLKELVRDKNKLINLQE